MSITYTHTPGKLHVAGQDKVQIRSEKHQIAKAWSFAGKTGQENARRLVACWNACVDMPTSLLESLEKPVCELLIQAAADRDAAVAQRDELLKALRGFIDVGYYDREIAITAIAKVEGGAV